MGSQAAGTGGVGAADSPLSHPSERLIARGGLYRPAVQVDWLAVVPTPLARRSCPWNKRPSGASWKGWVRRARPPPAGREGSMPEAVRPSRFACPLYLRGSTRKAPTTVHFSGPDGTPAVHGNPGRPGVPERCTVACTEAVYRPVYRDPVPFACTVDRVRRGGRGTYENGRRVHAAPSGRVTQASPPAR